MALELHMVLKLIEEFHNGTLLFLDNQVYAMLHASRPITQDTMKKLWAMTRKVTGDLNSAMDAFIAHYNEILGRLESELHKRGISVGDYIHKPYNINDLIMDNHEWAKGLLIALNYHYWQVEALLKVSLGDISNDGLERRYILEVRHAARFPVRTFIHNYEARLERINRRLSVIPVMAVHPLMKDQPWEGYPLSDKDYEPSLIDDEIDPDDL
jgi:hypothetical protein